jgi:hypothetical protein
MGMNGRSVIFLFAGHAYLEQIFVSKLAEHGCHFTSITLVDTDYTKDEKKGIRKAFTQIPVHFYELDTLSEMPIDATSLCIGFRPQLNGGDGNTSKLQDFVERYQSQPHTPPPIHLFKYNNGVAIEPREHIQDAIRRLNTS